MARKKHVDISLSTKEIMLRVFKYALKSKALLITSLICLLIFSGLEIIQPLIMKKVIDDELSGIATVWVKFDDEALTSDKTITFNNDFYQKDDGTITGSLHTISFFKEYYVLIDAELAKEDKIKNINESNLLIEIESTDGTINQYSYIKLDNNDLLQFYQASINPIIILIIAYAVVSIIIIITRYIQNVTFTSSSMRLTLDMRESAFNKLNRLPISYFSTEPKGKTVTKIIQDSEGVRGIYQVVVQILSAIITLVMIFIGLVLLDYRVALITLAILPFITLWMTVYRKAVNKYNKDIREMNSRINGKLAEFVNTAPIIQVFNKEEKMTNEYDSMLITNYNTKIKHLKINTIFGFELLNLFRRLVVAFIIAFFSYKFLETNLVLLATTIYVAIEYLEKIVSPISEIFNNLNSLEDSMIAASRVFGFLDELEDTGLGEVTGVRFKGDIEFKDIHFKYDEDNYVLKGVSLDVKAGSFVGIVGATGSGKSTLMSLLERYYDLETGTIEIDGVNFQDYSKQDIRNNIGIILQDPAIFEGTIKSNIAFGADLSDQEVEDLLFKIGGDKFVNELSDGINSKVNYMGENLSTGEKQLIAFARILVRNPSIMILDEATANIDTETESLIQNALTVLSLERTTFVIAHRLSTIKNADVIYVMDDGKIIEYGTHHELYQIPNGVYRKMYDALV